MAKLDYPVTIWFGTRNNFDVFKPKSSESNYAQLEDRGFEFTTQEDDNQNRLFRYNLSAVIRWSQAITEADIRNLAVEVIGETGDNSFDESPEGYWLVDNRTIPLAEQFTRRRYIELSIFRIGNPLTGI